MFVEMDVLCWRLVVEKLVGVTEATNWRVCYVVSLAALGAAAARLPDDVPSCVHGQLLIDEGRAVLRSAPMLRSTFARAYPSMFLR